MRQLNIATHSSAQKNSILTRIATRAIVLRGEQILLLFTERYHDYSLPGGGVDEDEALHAGLIRELQEETGAKNIRNIEPYGVYEEYRSWNKHGYDLLYMKYYCYRCSIDDELGDPQLEHHEIQNAMRPVWVNIYDAIAHNEETIVNSDKKGLSIERETFLLKLIAEELVES